ncbi:MAG: hypothetical protein KJ792_13920 [Actinobacteria bacterium]|nr:hypothetical protein [Actinomycetota bacterium]MCG2800997.1 hypothetical protein [Cellulomonas sp.]
MELDLGVLTFVAAALVLLAIRAGVRLVRGRASSWGLGVAALVWWTVLAAVAGLVEAEHRVTQQLATSVTVMVSGRPGAVARCARRTSDMFDPSGNAGSVQWDSPDVARLRADTCDALWAWITSDKEHPTIEEVIALHVLAHEAVHVGGERAEAATECAAMGWDATVARALGASDAVAQQIAASYRQQVYPTMPDEYRGGC